MTSLRFPICRVRAIARRRLFPILPIVVTVIWAGFVQIRALWPLVIDHWPISLTMVFGSFVAGATPGGGGAFAFPVFTKLLHISTPDSRTFSLMIQAVGMSMAGIVILVRRMPILRGVIAWASLGGAVGMITGTLWVTIAPPFPKLLFTIVVALFGTSLAISRLIRLPSHSVFTRWDWRDRCLLTLTGCIGGLVSAQTGTGIDLLTFVVLSLAYGIDEKTGTFSSVIVMAVISIVGSILHVFVLADHGPAFSYWIAAVPIVVFGAPIGSLIAFRLGRNFVAAVLLGLIALEVATTFWLIPLTGPLRAATIGTAVLCAACFWLLLRWRLAIERNIFDQSQSTVIPKETKRPF